MLMHSIQQLRSLQCQRLMHLGPRDILHTVDWTNLHCLEMLIQSAWNTQDPNMDHLLPNLNAEVHYRFFACEWCLQYNVLTACPTCGDIKPMYMVIHNFEHTRSILPHLH